MSKEQIGVITEQGDLGLGFDPLSEKDHEVVQESYDIHKEEKRQIRGGLDNENWHSHD